MTPLSLLTFAWMPASPAAGLPAVSGVITHKLVPEAVLPGTAPAVVLTASDRDAAYHLACTVGEEQVERTSAALAPGEPFTVLLPYVEGVFTAECAVSASFANGLAERKPLSLAWRQRPPEAEEAPPTPEPPAAPPPAPPADPAPSDKASD